MTKVTDPKTWTSIDIESSGMHPSYALQPWSRLGFLTSCAIAQYCERKVGTKATLPRDDRVAIKAFAKHHLTQGRPLIGWNVAFDAAWFIAIGLREEVMRADWIDAMLLWKAVDRECESHLPQPKRRKYGLKEAVRKYLPKYANYEENVNYSPQTDEEWANLLRYNRLDAALTLRLAHRFMWELRDTTQLRPALIEAKAIPHIADHFIRGLCVDVDWAVQLGQQIVQERDALGEELAQYGATPKVLASPSQLGTLLYEDWGLPVLKLTDKGARSTDKEALHELALEDDRAAKVKTYRELGNLKTKFVDTPIKSAQHNSDGRTHPTAILGGTYTGRMTFASSVGRGKDKHQTGFAIHQMSSKPDYRRTITAPEGYEIIEWDAAGQEFRWMAVMTGDETMLSLCAPGEDAHAYMGAEVDPSWEYRDLSYAAKHGDAEAGKSRKLGKVSNLSCQYRIGKAKFRSTARVQYGLPLTPGEASHMHDTYHRTYPGVRKYWRRAVETAKRKGYAETLAGRQVQLQVNWADPDTSWVFESAAINFPIQGVGADQKFLAIAVLTPLLKRYDAYFYFELHDGLYVIAPKAKAKKLALHGRKLLNNINYAKAWHGFVPPIPLPWDVKIGPNWGDMKELE